MGQQVFNVTFKDAGGHFEITIPVRTEGGALDAVRAAIRTAEIWHLADALYFAGDITIKAE